MVNQGLPTWQEQISLLAHGVVVVLAQRAKVYGDPRDAFSGYARLFGALLGTEISPAQVAMLLAALKLGRIAANPSHQDSWLDLAGYALIGALLTQGMACAPEQVPVLEGAGEGL